MTDDVIGPIYSGYVPFHPWKSGMPRLRDWKNPSDSWIFRQTFVRNEENQSHLKSSPRRDSNRRPLGRKLLRSEHSSTELAGPGMATVSLS